MQGCTAQQSEETEQPAMAVHSMHINAVRYFITMLLGYPLGFFFYHVLSPKYVSLSTRHAFSAITGLFLGYVCLGGWSMLTLLGMIGSNYLLLWLLPPTVVHRYTLVWAMAYMTAGNIYRLVYYYGVNSLDFSGPMMVQVTKVTYAAFALHDGLGRKQSDLSSDQRQQRLLERPSLLQYLSYTFNFHSFFAGPICTLKEHLVFMDGSYHMQPSDPKPRNVTYPVYSIVSKLVYTLLCLAVFAVLDRNISMDYLLDPKYMTSFPSMPITVFLAGTLVRFRFYLVWIMADSINNAAGMGFNGYDKDGSPKWDLMTNIEVIEIEKSQNMRSAVNAYNSTCGKWLRRVCFDRAPFSPTAATLLLSALWHGLYPAYYFMSIFASISLVAGRKLRRTVRPYFLSSRGMKLFYDVLSVVAIRISCDFMLIVKNFLLIEHALLYWSYFYYLPIITVSVVAVALPGGKSRKAKDSEQSTDKQFVTYPDKNSHAKEIKLG